MRRSRATAVCVSLVAGAALATAPHAQATTSAVFECQQVTYHSILPNTPLNGYPCTGPTGPRPAGTVLDVPTGDVYGCGNMNGSLINGAVFVYGNLCRKL